MEFVHGTAHIGISQPKLQVGIEHARMHKKVLIGSDSSSTKEIQRNGP